MTITDDLEAYRRHVFGEADPFDQLASSLILSGIRARMLRHLIEAKEHEDAILAEEIIKRLPAPNMGRELPSYDDPYADLTSNNDIPPVEQRGPWNNPNNPRFMQGMRRTG